MSAEVVARSPGRHEGVARAVAEAVADWGGEWSPGEGGGHLGLPVSAGLRRGWISGQLLLEPRGDGTTLRFRPEQARYELQRAAVGLLGISVAGGLFTMVWPFFAHGRPELLALAPAAALAALGGWFLVIARLRNSGPEEFLADVVQRSHDADSGASDRNPG